MQAPVIAIVAAMILIIAALAFYYVYPLYHAIQVSKGLEAKAVPYEQHPANPTMYILVAGDSTAYGTGTTNPQDSTAGQLGRDYPTADITNIAVNGLKLAGLIQALQKTPRVHYDLTLIQIGANDIVGGTSLTDVNSELQTVLTKTDALSTNTVLLTAGNIGLSPVFHFPLSSYITHRTLEVRTIFTSDIAQHPQAHYVDLYIDSINDAFASDVSKYYAADHFHPSPAGYALWYQQIQPTVASIISRTP
jgi:lysophospholipase L1-like esterase